jgi:hypothetical protein
MFPNNLVTDDNRMRDGVLDEDDRKLIDEAMRAASYEAAADDVPTDAIQVDCEGMEALADAAMRVYVNACKKADRLTDDQSRTIREWRVEKRWTWRRIARELNELGWLGKFAPASNQLVGMAACLHAAAKFGDNYMRGDWN